MVKNDEQYQALLIRLDQFIRKFYLNQVIRGALYVVGFATCYFLIIALLENYFYFNTVGRKILFFSFLGLSIFTFIRWILIPGLKYFRLGDTLSNSQAATIIGDHFPNVQDKLLNILQLREQAETIPDQSLILAGIEQKTAELRPIQFKSAIDLSKNKKYLKYALVPVLVLIVLLWAAPSLIKDSTQRLIHNNTVFERQAPFQYEILNKDMNVPEFDNYTLKVRLTGKSLPAQVVLNNHGMKTTLTPDKDGTFEYTFNNVQQDQRFRFEAAGFDTKPYELKVLHKAAIEEVSVQLDYPAYTGKKDETLHNIGDLIVPFGTKITWNFNTLNADKIRMWFEGFAPVFAAKSGDQKFTFYKTAAKNQQYSVIAGNAVLPVSDSVHYSLAVIEDQFPVISLDQFIDSTNTKLIYLNGNVADDYGLTRLQMVQQIKKTNGQIVTRTVPLPRPKDKQGFYSYLLDINDLKLQPGEDLKYYFEVFDNDGIKGPKSAKTSVLSFSKPTISEMKQDIEKSAQEIQKDMKDILSESKKVQQKIDKLKEKLMQQKSLSWEDKEQMEKLVEKQLELQKQLEATQKKLEEKQQNQEEVKPLDQEQKEKQDKITDMMKEMQTPAKDSLMDRINELLQKLDKKESVNQLDQMKKQNDQFNKSMERMMELLKTLELENKVKEQVDELNKLAEKQDKLADKTQNKDSNQDQLKKDQEDIKKSFDDVKKKMDEIQKDNEKLDVPKKLDGQQTEQDKVDQDLKDAEENLNKKQNSKASQSQKGASKKMKQMAKKMSDDMAASQAEQMEMDMAAIRQLLENILGLSFTQEDLMNQTNNTVINTPRYTQLMRDQMKVKTDFKMVDDSLQALSKRVMQIESFLLNKVSDINTNLDQSLEKMEDRNSPMAARYEQTTMTYLNDLALMLSDVMQQMQMQAAQQMPGDQMCSKPGGTSPTPGNTGKQPMDKITEGQKKLSDQVKDQLSKMKDGQKPGSEDFGQMAAEQAKLRKMLQDMDNSLRQQGQGKNPRREEIMKAMDDMEKDLVNRRLTNEMMRRQQEIMTRLLEEERAQRTQGQEDQRQANTAKEQNTKIPPTMQEYIRKREAGLDEYKPISPSLQPYYKRLVEQYYKQIRSK
jgi:hypothetical protein